MKKIPEPPPGYEEYIQRRKKHIQDRFPGLEASFTDEEKAEMERMMIIAGRSSKFNNQFSFLDYYEWSLEIIENKRKTATIL